MGKDAGFQLRNKKVLIIDDDPNLQELCQKILERLGYRCISAFNGREGLEKIVSHQPDLILLDLIMPEIDGEQVYRELLTNPAYQEYRDIPVVLLTATAETTARKSEFLQLGISAYLNKPFGLSELVNVIENVLINHEIKLRNVRLQEELRTANEYLERIINHAPIGILSTDQEGRILRINPFFVRMIGGESVDAFIGKNIFQDHLFERIDVLERLREVLERGESVEIPTVDIRVLGGWWIKVNLQAVPLRDEQGKISGLLSIWEDVTEVEKRAYELAILSQIGEAMQGTLELPVLLHLILTSLTAGCALGFSRAMIFLVDEQGQTLEGKMGVGPDSAEDANRIWSALAKDHSNLKEFLEKYGMSPPSEEKPFDKKVKSLRIPLDGRDDILVQTVLQVRPFYVTNALEDPRVDRDFQSLFEMQEFISVPLVAKNRVIGIIVADNKYAGFPIGEDKIALLTLFANQAGMAIENAEAYRQLEEKVKQLRQANEELRRAQDRLVRSERLATIGELAAHVAHEIRNPLTAIGGFAHMILKKPTDSENVTFSASIIAREVTRLEKILSNVLNYTRITKPVRKEHDFNQIIRETLQVLVPTWRDKKIAVRERMDGLLPPIKVDAEQMKQALMNIFSNCAASISNKGEIFVNTSTSGDELVVEIRDTGQGMSPEILNNMFNPFFTARLGGTGLGMAITHKIIEEHEGRIEVESEVGKGTRFLIYLPYRESSSEPQEEGEGDRKQID